MTDKRFTLAYEKGNWWAVKDRDITLWKEETIALLNSLNRENEQLKQELQKIQDGFELNWTQNRMEFYKDKLYIKDTNTEICLDNRNLSIRVRIPSLNEYYLFKYIVTGRSLMKKFVEKYNSKGNDKND